MCACYSINMQIKMFSEILNVPKNHIDVFSKIKRNKILKKRYQRSEKVNQSKESYSLHYTGLYPQFNINLFDL